MVMREGRSLRVTVCELPDTPSALGFAWDALCEHTKRNHSEVVLLPEFSMVDALGRYESFDSARWACAQALSDKWLTRLAELGAGFVVGTRPATIDGRPFNRGFLWSAAD